MLLEYVWFWCRASLDKFKFSKFFEIICYHDKLRLIWLSLYPYPLSLVLLNNCQSSITHFSSFILSFMRGWVLICICTSTYVFYIAVRLDSIRSIAIIPNHCYYLFQQFPNIHKNGTRAYEFFFSLRLLAKHNIEISFKGFSIAMSWFL